MAEKTYERLDLAKGQLATAFTLFLDDQNFASSITLAGAAEEILGRELISRGRRSTLDVDYESMAEFERRIGSAGLD